MLDASLSRSSLAFYLFNSMIHIYINIYIYIYIHIYIYIYIYMFFVPL